MITKETILVIAVAVIITTIIIIQQQPSALAIKLDFPPPPELKQSKLPPQKLVQPELPTIPGGPPSSSIIGAPPEKEPPHLSTLAGNNVNFTKILQEKLTGPAVCKLNKLTCNILLKVDYQSPKTLVFHGEIVSTHAKPNEILWKAVDIAKQNGFDIASTFVIGDTVNIIMSHK